MQQLLMKTMNAIYDNHAQKSQRRLVTIQDINGHHYDKQRKDAMSRATVRYNGGTKDICINSISKTSVIFAL
jgi:hypothetical protein